VYSSFFSSIRTAIWIWPSSPSGLVIY
jgi:hypothetical protein